MATVHLLGISSYRGCKTSISTAAGKVHQNLGDMQYQLSTVIRESDDPDEHTYHLILTLRAME